MAGMTLLVALTLWSLRLGRLGVKSTLADTKMKRKRETHQLKYYTKQGTSEVLDHSFPHCTVTGYF